MKHTTVLLIVVAIGAALRFTNVNWDSYQAFHPDERNIAWAVTRIQWITQLNPKFFAYGGLPIYLYKILTDLTAWVTADPSWTTEWGKIAVVGRYVSATLSSISLFLIYLVGRRFFSPAVGVLALLFLAFSPWAIREAHFATTETMLVFFLLLLLWINSKHEARNHAAVLSGIIWGLALGAKTTSLLFGIIPLTAIWIQTFDKMVLEHKNVNAGLAKPLLDTARLLLVAAAAFLLVSPYTIIDWTGFRESMQYETGVALGRFSVPYTLQFVSTLPYLYQIQTMLWQAGPVGIIGIVGIILLTRNNSSSLLLFLMFPLIYGVWSGSWYAKFARYTIPFLPFATLSAAWLTVTTFQKISKRNFYWIICLFVYLFIGLFHSLWGVANWTIYLRPQTRIEASRWIYDHVPTGSKLLTEHWNDGLAVNNPRELLNVYDEDSDTKMATLAAQLHTADYLILTTRRIWGTMPRLTTRYPRTSVWYKQLLAGELGYKEVASFTSYPTLFGITVSDDAAEESIQVFDHPTVRIFQNTKNYTH